MIVIFVLGFFLDFIEIAVVVVPIIAPILLAQTDANVTAVWLGVMIGVNMQTSFLTPPFGFSLFYLRGVAPSSVTTIQIWKGALVFIILQLVGLGIVGYFPSLVNYLPNRTYLTSEVAPPPMNPRLQECIQEYKFNLYKSNEDSIKKNINGISSLNVSYLPDSKKDFFSNIYINAMLTFELIEKLQKSEKVLQEYNINYKSLHQFVRKIQKRGYKIDKKIIKLEKEIKNLLRENKISKAEKIKSEIVSLNSEKINISSKIPSNWDNDHNEYKLLSDNKKKAVMTYRRNVDEVYENIQIFKFIINDRNELNKIEEDIIKLKNIVISESKVEAMKKMKSVEKLLDKIAGANLIKEKITKSRRNLKKNEPDMSKVMNLLNEANELLFIEKEWRVVAEKKLLPHLIDFDNSIKDTIGLRLQERLTKEQAKFVASCRSIHRDISLNF
tara:strand:- start:125 stop:1450 length:1326 start_codon:yes stop_codon:yes gene_type:complete